MPAGVPALHAKACATERDGASAQPDERGARRNGENQNMPVPKLSDDELRLAVASLPGWTVAAGKLHREYRFPDFVHAFGFMATSALVIEKMNHHPEWSNVYDRVIVDLSTHDSGGITAQDTALAAVLESFAGRML
jgi:4a-hydroxytetrahydrobiopterin dehydratase